LVLGVELECELGVELALGQRAGRAVCWLGRYKGGGVVWKVSLLAVGLAAALYTERAQGRGGRNVLPGEAVLRGSR